MNQLCVECGAERADPASVCPGLSGARPASFTHIWCGGRAAAIRRRRRRLEQKSAAPVSAHTHAATAAAGPVYRKPPNLAPAAVYENGKHSSADGGGREASAAARRRDVYTAPKVRPRQMWQPDTAPGYFLPQRHQKHLGESGNGRTRAPRRRAGSRRAGGCGNPAEDGGREPPRADVGGGQRCRRAIRSACLSGRGGDSLQPRSTSPVTGATRHGRDAE